MAVRRTAKEIISDDMKLRIKKILAIKQNWHMLHRKEQVVPYQKGRYLYGINLIGDISAETGLGQSVRILAAIMEQGGIPFCVKQVDTHGQLEHNDVRWGGMVTDCPLYGVNLIHFIPGTWAVDYCKLGKGILDGRYNIAYWLWELETFPRRWKPCIETVDEIWTPSEFISSCIRKETEKPVVTVPYAIDARPEARRGDGRHGEGEFGREYFGLPEGKFLFLVMYDFISISERKNPDAAIEAYCRAFPQEDGRVGLVMKVNHAEGDKIGLLKEKLAGYRNVYFITRNLTRGEVNLLMEVSDALVTLHRSEGFGLPAAEAMALGKPVVSTAWSATTEFMDGDCACLVDYRLIKLKRSVGPYEKGNYWADADTGHAASYMKRLVQDREYCRQIGRKARERIQEKLTYGHVADIMEGRLKEIYEEDSVG